jgi:secondary thiamine-phosphate synthase enzyme
MESTVVTNKSKQVIDVTERVQATLKDEHSAVTVFVAHTTCAVTTADLDPGTDLDLLDAVWQMIPKLKYRHPHNPAHVPAHLASSIIGPSVSVPVKDGQLVLGSWQRIVLIELDGPKERRLIITPTA